MNKTADTAGGRSQAVHRALKRAILDRALPPGMKLPEDSIGERLGVSRTLVREALVRLSEEGLVELRANSRSSLYVEISAGRIRIRKSGRKTLIAITDIQAWFDNLPESCKYTDSSASRI